MWTDTSINFIEPDVQWTCWYIRYKKIWWGLLVGALLGLVGAVAVSTYMYIGYQDVVAKQMEVQSHHVDATEAHQMYEGYVTHKDTEKAHTFGGVPDCIYLLDAANRFHVQLIEWSTLDQWYIEARGSNENELHQFSAALAKLGGQRHYDEVVEKEQGTAMYRARITGTVESATSAKKKPPRQP